MIKIGFYEPLQENIDNMVTQMGRITHNQVMNLQIVPTARDFCEYVGIHMNERQYEEAHYLSLKNQRPQTM